MESPRHEIREIPSSSGDGSSESVDGPEAAADLPTDPWNCVDFSPHPTFTGASCYNLELALGLWV